MNSRDHIPESARQSQVAAYAVAHRSWAARFGLPTHIEADILRACNGIGDTTADEWAENCTDAWRHVDRLRGVANSAPVAAAKTPPRLSERCERGH
jgi:hypothetical protein